MFVSLFLFAILSTAASSRTPLPSQIREDIDKYSIEKICENGAMSDAKRLIDRVKEVEDKRDRDMQWFVSHIKEVEEKRDRDMQWFVSHIKEVEQKRDRDMQWFVSSIKEVEDKRANDVRVFNKRIQEVRKLHAEEMQVFLQRLQEGSHIRTHDKEAFAMRKLDADNRHADAAVTHSSGLPDLYKIVTEGDAKITTNHNEVHGFNDTLGTISVSLSNQRDENKRRNTNSVWEDNQEKDNTRLKNGNHKEIHDSNERQIDLDINVSRRELASPGRRVVSLSGVAFHAVLANELVNPAAKHIIQFQDIKLNIGGNYHPTTGVFTCSQPGIYVFSWCLRINYGPVHGVNSEIVRNGVGFGRSSVGSGGSDDKFSQGSSTAAIQLDQGDEVWVRVHSTFAGTNIEPTYSMFTGFLVRY
ncbi:multimerin-2-like [Ylistrum balloti]|uniref:multimerin-2-like n=1 Tax=Ylistrum balloti TaxID=509963 RepID=UPI0029059144|nr:multimerin-2-like [Ylistrum balloti]